MTNNQKILIWGVGTIRTQRVHWMLHELELDYETRRIESRTGETTDAGFTALNPRQKIPLMVHGDLALTESYAIIHYLRSLNDRLPFDDFQQSSHGQARFDEWLSFILMELDATSLYVVRRHKDLHSIYGDAPAAVQSSIDYFNRMLKSIADQVEADKVLWGSCFSELDILFTLMLDWALFLDISLPNHLLNYREMMHARPAYQSAYQHNFDNLKLAPAGD